MITLHHVPGARSLRVLWLLEELGLDYRLRNWSLTDGSLRSEEFLALSPAGRVPAIEIDGRVIFESGAIVEYLAETHPEAGLAPAVGEPTRADYLEWLHFAETQANILQALNIHHIFLRPPSARSRPLMALDTKRLAVTMRALEDHLGAHEWLVGRFSAADCMMGFNIDAMFRFVRAEGFANLCAYRDRIAARPAYRAALEKDGGMTLYTRDFYELPDA
ncbi:glutathione S-transferase [Thioclava dalianensis]|uniref:Glutathione S-transferase n=1 Tax=Thioclava dalianensis TaxID=1185766 RepID=A0A074TPX1_9RHOB|nr:glutathione S-transferase family protein [Thioclava dalianensis]KEP71053.1 glutathione S-transferase [Thioclava dalianensis]SFN25952.1 glutathione S-transferase [Thioclava dalianensis]